MICSIGWTVKYPGLIPAELVALIMGVALHTVELPPSYPHSAALASRLTAPIDSPRAYPSMMTAYRFTRDIDL